MSFPVIVLKSQPWLHGDPIAAGYISQFFKVHGFGCQEEKRYENSR